MTGKGGWGFPVEHMAKRDGDLLKNRVLLCAERPTLTIPKKGLQKKENKRDSTQPETLSNLRLTRRIELRVREDVSRDFIFKVMYCSIAFRVKCLWLRNSFAKPMFLTVLTHCP